MRQLKIITVGNVMVGKSCLLISYTQNRFLEETVPLVYETYECTITVDSKEYSLTLWSTTGQDDFDRLRPVFYHNTDCFLICYSIDCKFSYEQVATRWLPEIRHFSPDVPIVLIGTKSDLRVVGSEKFVTIEDGKKLQEKIGAFSLVECSAKNRTGLTEVFEQAVLAVEKKSDHKRKTPCTIL